MNKIIIAGGGTGGHIYPGVAIARALQKLNPKTEVDFVGTALGLESKIVPKEGFRLHLIASGQLNIKTQPFRLLKNLFKIPLGMIQSFVLLRRIKPDVVLGVGGYASGPTVLMAALLRIPTAVWEPNAQPGLANRWLAPFVRRCYVVFEQARSILGEQKSIRFGVPIREEVDVNTARVASNQFRIFHYGGSQGSRIIGTALCETFLQHKDKFENSKIVHQTGSLDIAKFKEKYKGFESQVEVHEFIYDMKSYYQQTDLVICRGGASTIAEVSAYSLPAIIVPLPAADAHQEKNALALVEKDAAVMILQKDLNVDRLLQEIESLKNNPERRQKMSEQLHKFHQPHAADKIAQDICKELAK